MCEHCQSKNKSIMTFAKLIRTDPTKLSALRVKFVRDITKRFDNIYKVIEQSIVQQDCFGLTIQDNNATTQAGRYQFAFPRTADKVSAFMEWLQAQINAEVLEVSTTQRIGASIESAWTNVYIKDSYKRGILRARYEMKKTGVPIDDGISIGLDSAANVDRLGVLYTRAFEELKGITTAMEKQISHVLTQGLADGDGPRLLASKMNAVIRKTNADLGITDTLGRYIPAKRRAEMLARTEITRAHHQATMQEYENYKLSGVTVKAEWTLGGNACPICIDLENNNPYTLEEIRSLIPAHPNCKCVALPLI